MARLTFARMLAVPLALAATPALAASALVTIVPVTAVAASDQVVGDTLYRCAPAGCTTLAATTTPATLCAQAARKFGPIASVAIGTTTLDAAALAKCNSRARAAKAAPATMARY